MRKVIRVMTWLILSIGLLNACYTQKTGEAPKITENTEGRYRNVPYNVSLAYSSDWVIAEETDQFVVFAPSDSKSWQPSAPSDIPKDPRIMTYFGEYIREKLGPANFPSKIDPEGLRILLQEKVNQSEASSFNER